MTHKITLLVFSEDDTPENAFNNATAITNEYILPQRDAYRVEVVTHPDDPTRKYAISLDTPEGDELLDKSLERTRGAQKNILADLVEQLNSTTDFDDLLENDDFRHNCWRLGADNSPVFSFFDGTDWHRGTPIHSQETIDTIKQNTNLPLYLVVLTLN